MHYRCTQCHREYNLNQLHYRCECGGFFSLSYPNKKVSFTSSHPSLWRYREALPPFSEEVVSQVSMGEGLTPLIEIENNTFVKLDYLNPTLSFKDRGGVMLAALMKQEGFKECVIDSSGNGATSVSAYAARLGVSVHVFVPAATSAKKLEQIRAHNATVHLVKGDREETHQKTLAFVKEHSLFYASHIYNPLFLEGTKTYLYEIFDECKKMVNTLFVPVGNGTLLLGIFLAIEEFLSWNLITTPPKIIGVQAANCAPLATAHFSNNLATIQPTIAEGIAITHPPRATQILSLMNKMGGAFLTVSEEEIVAAHTDLAQRGFYVEYTAAANWAAYKKYKKSADETVVIPLCGSGLKT